MNDEQFRDLKATIIASAFVSALTAGWSDDRLINGGEDDNVSFWAAYNKVYNDLLDGRFEKLLQVSPPKH